MLLPDTLEALAYRWDDERHKFSFVIQPLVPYLIGLSIPQLIGRLLGRCGLKQLREGGAKRGEYGVFITMGPGAGVECALWRF